MSLVTHLKNAGLSDKEAKVYLAMLELGPASVLEIAAKAGVNRPTTYLQIEELKKRGLVSTQKKGKKDLFIAESPDQLEAILAKEKKVLEGRQEILKQTMPELLTLFGSVGDRPSVRYFEGVEGIQKILHEFLKVKEKKLRIISSYDLIAKNISDEMLDIYSRERISKGIAVEAIYVHSGEGGVEHASDPSKFREVRDLDAKKFPFTADITVFDNNVAIANIFSAERVSGTIITDKSIADSFRALFNLLWEQSRKL